jgi:hypothetical protein
MPVYGDPQSVPHLVARSIALYREKGFVETTPYWDHPADRVVFLERPLGSEGKPSEGSPSDGQ